MNGESPLTPVALDLVILATLALGASPALALALARVRERGVAGGMPYREQVPAASDAVRAPNAGALAIFSGIALVVVAPLALVIGLLSTISLSGSGDATAFVFDTLAAVACVALGPALIVGGRRLRRGEPTTRVVAAAAAVHAHVLFAVGIFATVADSRTAVSVGAGAAVVALMGVALGVIVVRSGSMASDDATRAIARRRLGQSAVFVGLLMALGAVLAVMLADEMGDRMTTRLQIEAYQRLQPHALGAFVLLGLAALLDGVVAFLALRRPA